MCPKPFDGQYANKRRGAIEDGGFFVIVNYWEFLLESRLNYDNYYTEQHNRKHRNICIAT